MAIVIDVHAKEDMMVTAGDFHFLEMGLQFVNDGGNDRGILLVRDLGVINVPTDGALRTFD